MYKVRWTFNIAKQQVHVSPGAERFEPEQTDEECETWITHTEINPAPHTVCHNILSQNQIEKNAGKARKSYYVASCMAVIDVDGKVLLTRRSPRLIFPNAYVLPGGHLDPGESLEQCCARELREECGIDIKIGKPSTFNGQPVKLESYFAFESVGKPDFKLGTLPPYSHLIVFWKVQLHLKAADIPMKLCPHEVGAAVWVPHDIVKGLLTQTDFGD